MIAVLERRNSISNYFSYLWQRCYEEPSRYPTSRGVQFAPGPLDHAVLWLILTATFACSSVWLLDVGVTIDFGSTWEPIEPVLLILLAGLLLYGIGWCSSLRSLRKIAFITSDLFLSISQTLAIGIVSCLLIYIAARVGAVFPMRDEALASADRLLGFDWDVVSQWIIAHPPLYHMLQKTYGSSVAQGGAVLLLGSIMRPGDRNREFIWTVAVSISLTAIVFAFVPAIGKIGCWDMVFVDRLLQIRSGISSMSFSTISSLISFPSFHTATAVLVTYAARRHWWSFVPAALLNAVMLAAISPIGGHYLVDMLGGALVALVSIVAVRQLAAW